MSELEALQIYLKFIRLPFHKHQQGIRVIVIQIFPHFSTPDSMSDNEKWWIYLKFTRVPFP